MTDRAFPVTEFFVSDGVPRALSYPDCRFEELVRAACHYYGDRTAIIDGDVRLTYLDLQRRVDQAVGEFRQLGISPGEVVIFAIGNGFRFAVEYLAAQGVGASVCAVSPLTPVEGIARLIADLGAQWAVVDQDFVDPQTLLDEAPLLSGVVYVEDGCVHLSGQGERTGPRDGAAPSVIAHYGLTGGTTGTPKAVKISHSNLIANVVQLIAWRFKRQVHCSQGEFSLETFATSMPSVMDDTGERALFIPPLFHAHALVNLWFLLLSGVTVDMVTRFNLEEFLESVEQTRPTYITGSPAMWLQILNRGDAPNYSTGSVKVISSGGAPLGEEVGRRLERLFPNAIVSETYGMTEATLAVSSGAYGVGEPRPFGSAGAPLPDTKIDIRVTDESTAGGATGSPTGEVWVQGPQISAGYVNNEEETQEQFQDGWLRTGDIGHVSDSGHLVITGRQKDVILYNGYSVYPRELEELLNDMPEIREGVVVGVPDELHGELPTAIVVLVPGAELTEEEIVARVSPRVVPYKRLRRVRILESMPRTHAGKIRREELIDVAT